MKRFHKGKYDVINRDKYVGSKMPTFRSSWENTFCRMCDEHPNITRWGSECVKIPYRSPLDNRWHNYYPDFLIQYIDNDGKEHVELIEIKPSGQSTFENARSSAEKRQVIVNSAKWEAATDWCKKKGIFFRVVNEEHIFMAKKKKKAPRKAKKRITPKRRK